MELTRLGAVAGAILFFLAQDASASSSHHHNEHLHRLLKARQLIGRNASDKPVEEVKEVTEIKRAKGQCVFPDDPDLVKVTPLEKNAGWAFAPDMECVPGKWCPYACVPGKVMTQWKPGSTYTVGSSTEGGLYCNEDGEIEKPFDTPYCVDGVGTVVAVNKSGKKLAFCQTVVPGYEDMIIPTPVGAGSSVVLAVPDTSYWCGTSAHYFIQPPGTGVEGCIWGSKDKAIGNWTPYVAGGNMDKNGNTFVTLGWNPVYFEEPALMATPPTFGVEITCEGGTCNGLPCKIGGGSLNGVTSNNKATGAGDADYCVVTVPKGAKAKINIFNLDGSDSGSKETGYSIESTDDKKEEKSSAKPSSTKAAEPSTSKTPTPSSSPSPTPTPTPTETEEEESSEPTSTYARASLSVNVSRPSITPGIFHENSSNGTSSSDDDTSDDELDVSSEDTSSDSSPSEAPSTPTESQQGEGLGSRHQGSAAAGLLVAFVAMVYLF